MSKNVFVMETKITNVGGRLDYISNKDRQENLCATYSTTKESRFWERLAEQNQQQFLRTGQGSREAKCGEAKELIIALPKEEKFKILDYNRLSEDLAEDFKKKYGVECDIAIHLNKAKTNLHAHLIFAERKKLPEPIIKYADRKVFLDEKGIRKRTKKEVIDESGEIRFGCKVIEKGEAISSEYFDKKIDYFKTKGFLLETKEHYAKLLSDISLEKYKVFDHKEPYLSTKHMGKGGRILYRMGLQQRNKEVAVYNGLIKKAMKSECINFDEAVDFKKETQAKIREANKLKKMKNEAVAILKKECERLKSLIAKGKEKKLDNKEAADERNKETEWFGRLCKEHPEIAENYLNKAMNDENISDLIKSTYQQIFDKNTGWSKEPSKGINRGRHR